MDSPAMQLHILDHIRNKQWKLVKDLLSSETYVEEVNKNPSCSLELSGTMLHLACSTQSVPEDIILHLIQQNFEAPSLEDEDGNLPIHLLCCGPGIRPDLVKLLLLSYPESSFLPSPQDQELPFYMLMKQQFQKYGEQATFDLIASLPPSLIYNEDISVLHQIGNGLLPESICLKIIDYFPQVCKLHKNGNTLLHSICSHEESTSTVIQKIISISPESCTVRDENGNIPLHLVNSQHHSIEIIRMLVQCYPKGLLVQNFVQQIPLVSPMIRNSPDRVKEILRFSSENDDIRQLILCSRNRVGMDPIRDYLYVLQRQISDLLVNGPLSIDDLSCWCVGNENKYTKQVVTGLKSLFHLMRLAAGNHVDYELTTPHQESFWTTFPVFVKALLQNFPELASHQDCVGNLPLHIIASHQSVDMQPVQNCKFCSRKTRGPYLWFQDHTYACKECIKIDEKCSNAFGNSSYPPSLVEFSSCELMRDVIAANPSAALTCNAAGNYPLHLSLKSGKTWCTGVRELVDIAPFMLQIFDKETNMLPFMLAAEWKQYDTVFDKGEKLSTIYRLLRPDPSVIG